MLEVRIISFYARYHNINVLIDINYIKCHFYMSTSIMKYYWYILISIKNTLVFTEMSQELFYWNIYCIIYLH